MSLRVLVACEYSGIVRDAFIRRGHDAISCDLLETESPGPHVVGDVTPMLRQFWDLVIAHPPCTYLCNVGWVHNSVRPGRGIDTIEAARFFWQCYQANARAVACENPVPSPMAKVLLPRMTDKVNPTFFGDVRLKAICLWTKQLPPLMSTCLTRPRQTGVWRTRADGSRQQYHWLDLIPGGKKQAKRRSMFFPAVADAMADQYSAHLEGRP